MGSKYIFGIYLFWKLGTITQYIETFHLNPPSHTGPFRHIHTLPLANPKIKSLKTLLNFAVFFKRLKGCLEMY